MLCTIQTEPIDYKTNSFLKMKFGEFPSASNNSGITSFWRTLPCEHFPKEKENNSQLYLSFWNNVQM